jgi:hypothetical protein
MERSSSELAEESCRSHVLESYKLLKAMYSHQPVFDPMSRDIRPLRPITTESPVTIRVDGELQDMAVGDLSGVDFFYRHIAGEEDRVLQWIQGQLLLAPDSSFEDPIFLTPDLLPVPSELPILEFCSMITPAMVPGATLPDATGGDPDHRSCTIKILQRFLKTRKKPMNGTRETSWWSVFGKLLRKRNQVADLRSMTLKAHR